jgi:hypothetical protein
MPNPEGSNQLARSRPQGAVKKLTDLTRAAPIPSPPNVAKQSQRKAVAGNPGPVAPVAVPPPLPQPSYSTQLAATLMELSALAPDDPLLAYYAAKAQSSTQ